MAYGSQPIVTSQPIPMQPTYQNINGYTVASSLPHSSPYMGGGPPSPNALQMGLSSSPGGGYPYVPPQQMLQGQQYAFPPSQNFAGYNNMAQQPMGMSPPEYGQTPMTPYRRRARSFNYNDGGY